MKKLVCLLLAVLLMVGAAGCGNGEETNFARIPFSQTVAHKKNYEEIVEKVEEAGFTNVKTEPIFDIITGLLTKDGAVEEVRVDGNADYSPDKKYSKDVEIVVAYHTYASNKEVSENKTTSEVLTEISISSTSEVESTVYYSTNNRETVKKGTTGVYSYCGDINNNLYYIINFDKGYVYRFTDDESDTCERIRIDSGNLNDVLIFTYHDGSTTWSNGLHFKWKQQPNHLILQDDDGFEWDFYPTDLSSALSLMSEKKIIDY